MYRYIVLWVSCVIISAAGVGAGTITGSFSPIATGSNVDLTMTGKSDWIQWGLYTDTSLNRKWGVPAQISDFALVSNFGATVLAYEYADNFNGYTWYDGWPAAAATNTTTGVWAYQAFPYNPASTGSGFRLTAPADTTTRTLEVFVGTYAARGQFKATLSDGGLPFSDTSLYNEANGPGGVYTLTYRANSPNQTLTVEWTLYQRALSNSLNANVTLQAAALNVANANNPPVTTLTSPADKSAFAAPANITLSASAEDFDGSVTNVAFYDGTNFLGQSASGSYTIDWNNVAPARYQLTSVAADNAGATRASRTVETFVYGTGGTLAGTVSNPPSSVDLTAEGPADWVHWGLTTNSSVDRKSGVPAQINFALLGTNLPVQFTDNFTAYSWTDGTPTASATNSTTGIYLTGFMNGFSVTAPADTNSRHIRIYVGCYGAVGTFEAWLSDLSAAPYIDTGTTSEYGNAYAVYDLVYAAASAGQQLSVVFYSSKLFDFDYGNVTLQAVSLSGSAPAASPVFILTPQLINGDFIISFATQTGHTYSVQYSDSLPASNWNTLEQLPGTGQTLTTTNSQPTASQRFYRVVAY